MVKKQTCHLTMDEKTGLQSSCFIQSKDHGPWTIYTKSL